MTKKLVIGFIGQGYVGKSYADDFESRGYTVVRYAKEKPYDENKEQIKNCDIVFIAVPTPTMPKGYDIGLIKAVLPLIGVGKIAVLKSTVPPGVTGEIQKEFPERIILNSPEFLSEATAREDVSHPFMNIVGLAGQTPAHEEAAKLVHSILPAAPESFTVKSEEAELIKYSHNCSGYTQIIFFNLMYDLTIKLGADWQKIEPALKADPLISSRYASPVHKSGRGAGGRCFIKDFAALKKVFEEKISDDAFGLGVLAAMEEKNKSLLKQSNKDLDLLEDV